MALIKNNQITNVGGDVEREPLYTVGGNVKIGAATMERKQHGGF